MRDRGMKDIIDPYPLRTICISAGIITVLAVICIVIWRTTLEPGYEPESSEAKAKHYVEEGMKHFKQSQEEKVTAEASLYRQMARQFFESALAYDESNVEAPVGLARTWYFDDVPENVRRAEDILCRALLRHKSAEGLRLLGFVRLSLTGTAGTPDKMKEYADLTVLATDLAMEWNPSDPWPYVTRASVLQYLNKLDEAKRYLKMAEHINVGHDKAVSDAIQYRRKLMEVEWHTAKAMPKED